MDSFWQVSMAHFAVSKERPLITSGVGSCIVIALYDPIARVGGIAHPMLPDGRFEDEAVEAEKVEHDLIVGSSKTVGRAVDMLLHGIESMGGRRDRCVAKVAGGAHMFRMFDAPKEGVGAQNIQAVKIKCGEVKVPIVAEDP